MRRLLLASVCFAAMSASAYAADMAVKAAPVAYPPAWNWTGAYIGLNIGGGWVSGGSGGVIGGAQIGYNWQASNLVFGLEADIQASGVRGNTGAATLAGVTLSETDRQNYFGTVRGRLGVANGPWLFYVTGGWAYTTIHRDGTATGAAVGAYSANNSKSGYALGLGAEWMFARNWSAKLEYLNLGFSGDTNTYATVPAITVGYGRWNENIVRVGANYHF